MLVISVTRTTTFTVNLIICSCRNTLYSGQELWLGMYRDKTTNNWYYLNQELVTWSTDASLGTSKDFVYVPELQKSIEVSTANDRRWIRVLCSTYNGTTGIWCGLYYNEYIFSGVLSFNWGKGGGGGYNITLVWM